MSVVDNQRIKSDGHEIVIGRHSLAEFAEILSTDAFAGVKLFILVDENTLEHCLPILVSKVPPLRDAEVLEVAPGEESKSLEISEQLWAVLGEMNADRSSVLVNLGGGVVSDLGGFIAGTFKRGIRFFNVPTSLLAQVDASAGGKVGVNLNGLKNEIGLFKNPHRVYIDPEFLKTLPKEHLLSGFSEMIKHALICDAEYWKSLQEISFYKLKTLDSAILKSVRIKNEIVSSDPFENGRRKILNFGHTIGHALESQSFEGDSRTLLHGEAVAAGMVMEAFISHKKESLTADELHEISSFIFSLYPKVQLSQLTYHRIVELMKHDKKNRDGQMRMSLLNAIGDCAIDREVRPDLVIEALHYYERWVS